MYNVGLTGRLIHSLEVHIGVAQKAYEQVENVGLILGLKLESNDRLKQDDCWHMISELEIL